MLPHAYGPPAAALLVLGAMLGSSMMGVSNTTGMIVAALIGGVAGALLLGFAYFIGIALVGAGLGALVAHVGWGYRGGGDPPAALIIGLALLGSLGALLLQRYVIIVATAFGGAWTALVGGLALAGDRGAARAASAGDVWIQIGRASCRERVEWWAGGASLREKVEYAVAVG